MPRGVLVFIFSIACLSMPLKVYSNQQQLLIKKFTISFIEKNKFLLKISASENGNIKIGSFSIRLENIPLSVKIENLPKFKMTNNFPYLISTDFKENAFLLKDNGLLDRNKLPGVFETILDCQNWPVGKYKIKVFVTNRPSSGSYYFDSKQGELFVNGSNTKANNLTENLYSLENNIIWKDTNIYACFPTLTKLKDGTLLTTFAARKKASHINPEGRNLTLLSKDNGYSWLKADPSLIYQELRTKDNALVSINVGGWKYSDTTERSRLKSQGKTIMMISNKQIAWMDNSAYINISNDNGKTWVKNKITIPSDINGLLIFQTKRFQNGTWIVSMYGPRKNLKKKINSQSEVYFLRSEDDAKTWKFVYQTPNGLKNLDIFNETSILKMQNGELLAMQRSSDDVGLFSSISSDEGKTWSYPKQTEIWGYPADMTILSNGKIICAYGYRRPPLGIRACISKDNGRTWDIKHEIVIRSDAAVKNIGDLGYPKITELPDGQIFVIYYISTDEQMPFIASSHFRIKNY